MHLEDHLQGCLYSGLAFIRIFLIPYIVHIGIRQLVLLHVKVMAGLQSENPPYWSGGIPAHIRCHDQPIPWEQLDDQVQGWLVYLDVSLPPYCMPQARYSHAPTQENVVPRPADGPLDNGTYELDQRRRLVSAWSSMSQAQRDAYQQRGTALPRRLRGWRPPPGCFKANTGNNDDNDDTRVAINVVNFISPQPLSSARDRAAWTKIRIMLYRLDGEQGPLIDDGRVSMCIPNPANEDTIHNRVLSPGDFVRWNYVENADFHRMLMTSVGTVVFYGTDGPRVLVDREALDTGRVLLCEFANNGSVEANCRVRPCILYEFWPLIENLGKPVRGVMERDVWKSVTFNGPYVYLIFFPPLGLQ